MQVVGASLFQPSVAALAGRTTRQEIADWARRVVFRHIKRTPELLAPVRTPAALEKIMEAEKLAPEARARIVEAFQAGEPFYAPHGPAVQRFLRHASDTLDYVMSLPGTDRRIKRIDRMSWGDAEALSVAWHAALAKAGSRARSLIAGTSRIMEFEGGYHVAELLTKEALAAEGGAMGHCVGGYWNRVQSGETRIVSIRDGAGSPHVTIELGRAPRLRLDDGSEYSVSEMPRPGFSVVREVGGGWIAVQVRGKGNEVPVEKYLKLLYRYLQETGMRWSEAGAASRHQPTGREISVFRYGDVCGLDPDRIARVAEPDFLQKLSRNPLGFGNLYRSTGLSQIHANCFDKARVAEVAADYLPHAMRSVSVQVEHGVPFQRAVGGSGVSDVVLCLSAAGVSSNDVGRTLLDLAVAHDAAEMNTTRSVVLELPGEAPLFHIHHSLPLMSLGLLSMGAVPGFEHEVMELVRPSLRNSLSMMKSNPEAVHSIAAAVGGIDSSDIVKAFLFCGLAREYQAATEAVSSGVRRRASAVRLHAKRERTKPGADVEAINYVSNMLSEGFEARLRERCRPNSRRGLLVAPEAPAAVKPRVSAEHVMRKYALPGRR